jgi:hypothetical protein
LANQMRRLFKSLTAPAKLYFENDVRDTFFCAVRPIYAWEPRHRTVVTGNARLEAGGVILLGRSEDGSAVYLARLLLR